MQKLNEKTIFSNIVNMRPATWAVFCDVNRIKSKIHFAIIGLRERQNLRGGGFNRNDYRYLWSPDKPFRWITADSEETRYIVKILYKYRGQMGKFGMNYVDYLLE